MNLDFRTSTGDHKFDVVDDLAEVLFFLLIERPSVKVVTKNLKYGGEKPEKIKCIITENIEGFKVQGFSFILKKGEYVKIGELTERGKKKLKKVS